MDNLESRYQKLLLRFPLIKRAVLMSTHTSFKIGGPADLFITSKNTEELRIMIQEARELDIPVFIFGGGSNILVGDKGIRGLVIKNMCNQVKIGAMRGVIKKGTMDKTVMLDVESGMLVNSLVRLMIESELSGFEWHLGLPGSLGGALYMNSKWTKPEHHYIGDPLESAVILTSGSAIKKVSKDFFQFGYDKSILQKTHDIVLSARFIVKPLSKDLLWRVAQDSMEHRKTSQPNGVFTLGCTFRNISKLEALTARTPDSITSAGYLIDASGLKGYRIGNVRFSQMHANFIENVGGGTASNVVQLIEIARLKVKKNFGVTLQEEIVRVGEF